MNLIDGSDESNMVIFNRIIDNGAKTTIHSEELAFIISTHKNKHQLSRQIYIRTFAISRSMSYARARTRTHARDRPTEKLRLVNIFQRRNEKKNELLSFNLNSVKFTVV